ncbi:hypothetical protein [Nocardia sp. GTS18]|uniref:hypothetical protein n=1 Tax=Nocardia sp. GTS18 TaxID=1778064 RepID=UPI0015EF7782|nr:hypothetical protein [Nocardia sp. GTS18]
MIDWMAQLRIETEVAHVVANQVDEHATTAMVDIGLDGNRVDVRCQADTQFTSEDWSSLSPLLTELVSMHHYAGTGLRGVQYNLSKNPDATWACSSAYDYDPLARSHATVPKRSLRRRMFGGR